VSDPKTLAEAERSGRPFLVFSDRDGRQHVLVFERGSRSASVGRQPASDVVLDWDDQVSRLHARFECIEDAWVVTDDGLSSNGTFVNQQRVDGSRRLNDGDVLRFGTTTVTFREPRSQRPAPANDANPPPGVALSTTQRRILAALCRPYKGRSGFASPAGDQQIAEELFLSVGEVQAHLEVLCAKLGISEAVPAERRVRLVETAFSTRSISERDL
jgi:pSer/pThr/pTyr-binding forkhead associated (FHA) protein